MYGAGVSSGLGGSGGGTASPRRTGWGNYRDTQYTEQAPFTLAADTPAVLPNNAGVKDESQLPEDVSSFYNPATSRISGSNGSDFILTVRLRLKATTAEASAIKLELQINDINTGLPVAIETASRTIPWGLGQEHALNFTFSGYARQSFAASGAQLLVTSDGPIEIYGVSYVIKRTHKGV